MGQAELTTVETVRAGIKKKARRRRRGERTVREEVLVRGETNKAGPSILLCAPLRQKGPRGKVQSTGRQWHDVQAVIFWWDNIPRGSGQGDQCWRCTKEAGQVPWPLLRMTACAFPIGGAVLRVTDAEGNVWLPRALRAALGHWRYRPRNPAPPQPQPPRKRRRRGDGAGGQEGLAAICRNSGPTPGRPSSRFLMANTGAGGQVQTNGLKSPPRQAMALQHSATPPQPSA